MKYILDFDGVIFNTEALKEKMSALGISEAVRGMDAIAAIQDADPKFDFAHLVFPGAREFLLAYGEHCVIVSSAFSENPENNTNAEQQRAFQCEKIRLAGMDELLPPGAIHVVGAEKKEVLETLQKEYDEEILFLDDREVYIREARELGIEAVWMDREKRGRLPNREGLPPMLEFPRVSNFEEFRSYLRDRETST